MELYNAVFVLQFLAVIGIFLVKLYNILTNGELYDARAVWLLFIGWCLAYCMGLVVFLLNPTEKLFLVFFQLETWLLVFNIVFLLAELFLIMKSKATVIVQPHNSRREALKNGKV